jgi:hypothetical protein
LECLEAIRSVAAVDSVCVLLDGAEFATTGAELEEQNTALSFALSERGRLVLRQATALEIGPHSETLLALLADQVAATVERLLRSDAEALALRTPSGEARSPG